MSEDEEKVGEEEENPALSALLKRSLKAEEPPPEEDKKLLENVQRKLRQRSKGKFYADGWSTTHARFNYILIAAIMLATVVAVYLAMGPTGITR